MQLGHGNGTNCDWLQYPVSPRYSPTNTDQQQPHRPSSLLNLTAANGEPTPHDAWVELTFNLPGNEDPSLAIRVPFLVSRVSLARPILCFSVIQELIFGCEGVLEVVAIIAQLLKSAMQIEEEQA